MKGRQMSKSRGYYIAIPFFLISLAILLYVLVLDRAPKVPANASSGVSQQTVAEPNASSRSLASGRSGAALESSLESPVQSASGSSDHTHDASGRHEHGASDGLPSYAYRPKTPTDMSREERVQRYKELLESQYDHPNAVGAIALGGRTFEMIPNTAYRLLEYGFNEKGYIYYTEEIFGTYVPLEDGRISPGTRVIDLDENLEVVREFTSTGDEMTEEEVWSFLQFLADEEHIPELAAPRGVHANDPPHLESSRSIPAPQDPHQSGETNPLPVKADRPDSPVDVSTREQEQMLRAVMELVFVAQGGDMEAGILELRRSDPETMELLERHLGSLEAVMERVHSARQIRKAEKEEDLLRQHNSETQ